MCFPPQGSVSTDQFTPLGCEVSSDKLKTSGNYVPVFNSFMCHSWLNSFLFNYEISITFLALWTPFPLGQNHSSLLFFHKSRAENVLQIRMKNVYSFKNKTDAKELTSNVSYLSSVQYVICITEVYHVSQRWIICILFTADLSSLWDPKWLWINFLNLLYLA